MLLLCKNCNNTIFYFKNDMYKKKNIRFEMKLIGLGFFFNLCCKFCHIKVGIQSVAMCKKCLLEKQIINEKNFINYYNSAIELYICEFCRNRFIKMTFINKNNYIFKIF